MRFNDTPCVISLIHIFLHTLANYHTSPSQLLGGTNIPAFYTSENINSKKRKAVPLHAMEVHGGRGDIAPTHT
jgi:hypothetical protein